MSINEETIEAEIQAKGLTAPRLTPADIDACIVYEHYYVWPDTTATSCMLTLKNGYGVFGESAAVSAQNFDAELGRKIAKDNARNKIWTLEGYRLKSDMSRASGETRNHVMLAETGSFTVTGN